MFSHLPVLPSTNVDVVQGTPASFQIVMHIDDNHITLKLLSVQC